DKATNKEQSIRITSSSGLSKEEVEKMKNDAQSHAAEDKKRKEDIEIKNQADSLVFQTRKQLKDLGDKIPADIKSKVETAANALEEAIKSNNMGEIKAKSEVLNNVWNEASTKMYESVKNQAGPGAGAAGGAQNPFAGQQPPTEHPGGQQQQSGGDGDKKVENADFEVVDDK
ncbi:MAG: Hsp70 family protein, partial [Bacteroidota bacterium]